MKLILASASPRRRELLQQVPQSRLLLKDKTFRDDEAALLIMKRLQDLLAFSLPMYAEEGKTNLVIGIGCTGGHHRSVAVTHVLAEHIRQQGYHVTEAHRDISRT